MNNKDKIFLNFKNAQQANAFLVEELNNLIENGRLSINQLNELKAKTENIIEQLSFWIERGNLDRMHEELTAHMGWIVRTFKEEFKKS